jgi:hypothetical protein
MTIFNCNSTTKIMILDSQLRAYYVNVAFAVKVEVKRCVVTISVKSHSPHPSFACSGECATARCQNDVTGMTRK